MCHVWTTLENWETLSTNEHGVYTQPHGHRNDILPFADLPRPATFQPLPEGMEWHNPHNLTPEQVGEDWRLLVKGEKKPVDVQSFRNATNGWCVGNLREPVSIEVTYRTHLPLPTWHPWTDEEKRRYVGAMTRKYECGVHVYSSITEMVLPTFLLSENTEFSTDPIGTMLNNRTWRKCGVLKAKE